MNFEIQTATYPAVDILARSFEGDPVLTWISCHPRFRETFFDITLSAFVPHRLTYIEEEGRGAAAWLGPNQTVRWPVTPRNVWRMLRVCGIGGFRRFLLSGSVSTKFHPVEPHYYLFLVGALSENRGEGIGSALLTHILRKCDEENVPAYLENSNGDNLPFYARHGFEVLREIKFAKDAPTVWLMWREARDPA